MPELSPRARRLLVRAAWVALAAINAVFLAVVAAAFLQGNVAVDWIIFSEAGRRVLDGGLYDFAPIDGTTYNYVYSPLLAYLFVIPIPLPLWQGLHFAALLLLPRRIALLTLVTFPFWVDLYNAGVMTFLFVAAWRALHGGRGWATVFMLGFLLAPRPPLLPVVAWLTWRRPSWRLPFAGLLVAYVSLVALSGWGAEWVAAVAAGGPGYTGGIRDLGPSRVLGGWWLVIGLPLAGWLTFRSRVGLASLFASPYWTPQYAMLLLLDLYREPPRADVGSKGDGLAEE